MLDKGLVTGDSNAAKVEQGTGGLEVPEPGTLPSVVRIDEVKKPDPDVEFAAHEFIATFEPGTSKERQRELLEQHDLWTIRDLSQDDGSPTVLLLATGEHPRYGQSPNRMSESEGGGEKPADITAQTEQGRTLLQSMRELLGESEIANVGFNFKLKLDVEPDDPLYPDQDWLNAAEANPLNAESAWEITKGTSDLALGVIDSGISFSHPEFGTRLQESESDDFVENPEEDPGTDGDESCMGHGTAVAGVAAATGDNAEGVSGLDWNSEIVSLRVQESDCIYEEFAGYHDNMIAALNHVESVNTNSDPEDDLHVVNISMSCECYNAAEESAANDAYNSGALLVNSLGNAGVDTDENPNYPGGYSSVAPTVALDTSLTKPEWANYGSDAEYAGQGVEVLTTCYDPQTDFRDGCDDGLPVEDAYGAHSGSSFASPNAAGVSLLGWSNDLSYSNAEIRALTHDTGINVNDENPSFSGLLGRHVNAYQMVRTTNQNSAGEPNDSFPDATPISPLTDQWQFSQFWNHSADDQTDWYSFELDQNERLAVIADWFNLDVAIELALYDSGQSLLEEGADLGETSDSLTYKTSSPQTVYLEVTVSDGGDGSGGPNGYDLFFTEQTPEIESLSDSAAQVGETVTVSGVNFTASRENNESVRFADGQGGWIDAQTYPSWSSTQIEVNVPAGAQNSADGVQVKTTLNNFPGDPVETSNTEPFEVIPRIDSVDTSREYTWGDEVVIDGVGFGLTRSSSKVTFMSSEYSNTVAETDTQFNNWQDDQINVLIPDNSHSGPLKVTKAGHDSEPSSELTIVLPPPPDLDGDQF